ncbi:MAG: Formamidopyrimidine-DNA glycosylase [Candidatus Taylorbacteria bacterium]|nr:Formamidopyrimidine-DNA glycosylase [Candidatus Taylorbacteria bacterium]
MPELPEVQTTVNGINTYLKGLTISDLWTNYSNMSGFHTGKDHIKDPKFFTYFKKQVIGRKIQQAKRRAKNILIELDNDGTILVHLKMTGHLMYGTYVFDKTDKKDPWKGVFPESLKDPFNRHIRFIVTFSNGKYLALSDMRKFAKVTYIAKDQIEKTLHLKDLGPEPLDPLFTKEVLKMRLLKRPNGKIKTVLLDPKIVVGIGNIYSDEILWRAGIHPERIVKNITDKEFGIIFEAAQETLKKGIDFGGDSMSDYRNILGERGKFQAEHKAYRKTGTKCEKKECGGTIKRKVIGGRSAHFCDMHQK